MKIINTIAILVFAILTTQVTQVLAQSTNIESAAYQFRSDVQVDGTLIAKFPPYYITNTVVISNSLDFAVSTLPQNNLKIRYMTMFLSATNEAATSKRAIVSVYSRSDRLCDSLIYLHTNLLFWTSLSTTAVGLGASTSTVSDASGVVLYDRYSVGNGITWDWLTATNKTSTTINWACTNKYATTTATLISHANYFTPIYFDDESNVSSIWFRVIWTTPATGTVTTITKYSR